MNREQAINYLISSGFTQEQVCEVVRALTYAPTTKNNFGVDCISRADARKAIVEHQYSDSFCEEHNIDHSINTGMALIALSDLPSVTPQLSVPEVAALAEWTEKLTKECEEAYNKGYADGKNEQKPKTGHWIEPRNDDGMSDPIYYQVRCSECGFDLDPQTWHVELHQYNADKYCPNCGAKMESEADNGNDD